MIMNPMMMKKIQKMQKDMLKAQKDIEESVFTGSAAGGMVTIEVKGTKEINKVNINPSVVDLSLIHIFSLSNRGFIISCYYRFNNYDFANNCCRC